MTGEHFRAARGVLQLTMGKAADAIGLSMKIINRLENGKEVDETTIRITKQFYEGRGIVFRKSGIDWR
jgi:DNA-binding XRE family transcriptional regulator